MFPIQDAADATPMPTAMVPATAPYLDPATTGAIRALACTIRFDVKLTEDV